MSLVEFTEFLVKKLAKEPDLIKVKDFETEEGLIIEVLVSEADMGNIIGKNGRIVNSIKTLVQARAYNDGIHNVKVNIDSF